MRFFNWTFDQKNKRVRVEPHAPKEPVIFEPIIAHGIVMVPKSSGFRVTSILKGTPAAAADIQPGDVVTHFNGTAMAELGCDFDISDHDQLTVILQRQGCCCCEESSLCPSVQFSPELASMKLS